VRDSRSQRGSALVEVTWLSLLLLVPLLYIVLAVFEVQRSAFGVTSAARAAGRAYATAPSESEGLARARLAAAVSLQDQGVATERLDLTITCHPDPGNCLAPGAVIDVDVAYPVALPLVPSALGGNTPSIRVSASHRVPYGTFREDR
jgi:Flp pilus assembly protein TadG